MSAWQPIETVPRDGRLVRLTWMDKGEPQEIAVMEWNPYARNGLFPGKVGMWVAPDMSFTWNDDGDGGPTHWQPVDEVQDRAQSAGTPTQTEADKRDDARHGGQT